MIGRESRVPGLSTIPSISSEHVMITRVSQNRFRVTDKDSKNGTYLFLRRTGWRNIKQTAILTGDTLISLGSSHEAFQFRLPSPVSYEYLNWKARCVTTLAQMRSGEVMKVVALNKRHKPIEKLSFELMREVLWTFKLHYLYKKNRILVAATPTSPWATPPGDISLDAHTEIRIGGKKGGGFFLPGPSFRAFLTTKEGDVISFGRKNFENPPDSIEEEHVEILVIDRRYFMVTNKSVRSAIYYRPIEQKWLLLEDTAKLHAGTDLLIGSPGNCICFTLPFASSASSLESHFILD